MSLRGKGKVACGYSSKYREEQSVCLGRKEGKEGKLLRLLCKKPKGRDGERCRVKHHINWDGGGAGEGYGVRWWWLQDPADLVDHLKNAHKWCSL